MYFIMISELRKHFIKLNDRKRKFHLLNKQPNYYFMILINVR